MTWFQTLLPVVTLIAGGLLQYLSQWGADARQRRAAQDAHFRELQERRENFELDHLVRLTEALDRSVNVTGKVVRRNRSTAREAATDIPQQVPPDLEDEVAESDQALLTLIMLVLEDGLRDTVARAHQRSKTLRSMKAPLEEGDEAIRLAADAMARARVAISNRLRQIYLGNV